MNTKQNSQASDKTPNTFSELRQKVIDEVKVMNAGKLKKLLVITFIRSLVILQWIAWPFIRFSKFEDFIMSQRGVWLPHTRALISGTTIFVAVLMCVGAIGIMTDGGDADVSIGALYFWPLMFSVLVTVLVGWFNASYVSDGGDPEKTFVLTPTGLIEKLF